jgi:DNA-binding transcriptional MerR regulator
MSVAVTISQAAAFAGVTVKTVRHYHRLGLVDEPERDLSGYRRYDSTDLLRLVQVRTLAGAGVPLAEIGPLLDADGETFAAALTDVERRLAERIAELEERRKTLRRLATGDRVLLPARACVVMDRLTELGFDDGFISAQWEGLVLARALAPEFFDGYLTQLEHRLDDPRHVDLLKRTWAAVDWEPDDPRLDDLAAAMADNLLSDRDQLVMPAGFDARPDAPTRYRLMNQHRDDQLPTMARLTELIEEKLRAAGLDVPFSPRRASGSGSTGR